MRNGRGVTPTEQKSFILKCILVKLNKVCSIYLDNLHPVNKVTCSTICSTVNAVNMHPAKPKNLTGTFLKPYQGARETLSIFGKLNIESCSYWVREKKGSFHDKH